MALRYPEKRSSRPTVEGVRRAVVTGGNRGIGLEVGRQLARDGFEVILGSRDPAKGAEAVEGLRAEGLSAQALALDIADPQSVADFGAELERGHDRLDVLVNNAAGFYDTGESGVGADLDLVRDAFETNVLGAWRTTQACLPLLRRSESARIVNVSSGGGALTDMGGGTPAYRVSKTALNALTRILAAELRADRILVNSVCPGWVATDMGGPGGRPVEAGAASVLWAVRIPDDGPTGGFFRDGRRLDW
jgi:NAD(P)-dependent dehydrogenase (short-subunit alcohol dehydrogenase family)